jgi:glycosyltransferase involved in cell wall biosynthesis
MRMMSESGVLLLLTELEEMGSAPGRVYEYLAAGRPIMSVGAACEISSLLAGLPDCLIVDGSDPGQIMQALVNLLNQDEEPTSLEGRQSLLRQYTFRELSGKLAGLLNKIVMP